MSVRYVDHPAEVTINPTADWFPFWKTSTGKALKCTVNNMVATATLPGANLPAGSVPISKLANISSSTLLGRYTGGAGPVQEIALTSGDFSLSGGVLSLANAYQPADADLTAIAALTTQTFGRSLLTLAAAADLRTAAQLLTPTGWGATDKLVTTHLGSMLIDIGSDSNLNIIPTSSATNVSVQIFSKGSSSVILADDGPVTTFELKTTGITMAGGPVTVSNTSEADIGGNASLIVAGGIRAAKRVLATGLGTMAGSTIQVYNADNTLAATIDNTGGTGIALLRLNTTGTANGVLITSTTTATSDTTGALRVAGGVGITGHLYIGPGNAAHILSDGAAHFGSGQFVIGSDGGLSIGTGGKLIIDEDGNTKTDGTFSTTPQFISLGPGAVTFAVTSSVVVLTGDGAGNTIATITGGAEGMRLDIYCADALVTFTDTAAATANTIDIPAGFTGSANDIISLLFINGKWFGRSPISVN